MATATDRAAKPQAGSKIDDTIRDILGVEPPAESIVWINKLIYGDPGSGKTFFLGTAADHPDTSPLLIFDIEGGVMTLRNKPEIDVVQIRSMKQLQDNINALAKQPEMYYKTIGIDGITELQKLDMRTVMNEQYQKRPDSTDIYVPSQREWGKSGERVRMIVRALRDLECNVIMTALKAEVTDERTNKKQIYPSIPGKLKTELPGFFDIVGYYRSVAEGGELVRKLQVVGTESVIAKDRSGALDSLITDPSVPMLWEQIHSDSNSNSKQKAKAN